MQYKSIYINPKQAFCFTAGKKIKITKSDASLLTSKPQKTNSKYV